MDMQKIMNVVDLLGIKAIYPYGSMVYQTNTIHSDEDYVIIADKNKVVFDADHKEFSFYTENEFIHQIHNHEITALECISLEKQIGNPCYTNGYFHQFSLHLPTLRKSISAKSSNSWVKAKKKFDVENEPYIAKKSLFHSLRILDFGMQVANFGLIKDFKSASFYFDEIMANPKTDWESYKVRWQPVYNSLHTEFKKVAPKEI